MQPSLYYRHSGKVGPLAVPYILGFGLAGAFILGPVYAYVDYFIPIIYLNLVACVFYGVIIGMLVGAGAKRGKVRSESVAVLGGLLVGLIALYVAWVFWFRAASEGRFMTFWPPTLWEAIREVNARGVWRLRGSVVKGTTLYIAWIAEALTIVGSSALVAYLSTPDEPFCEGCDSWIKDKRLVSPLQVIADPKAFRARLERGEYEEIIALRPVPAGDPSFTSLELLHCSKCRQSFFLTAKETTITIGDDGSAKRHQKTLVGNMVIESGLYDALSQQWTSHGSR